MQKLVLQRWAKAIREFTEQPSCLQLRFPMTLDTTKGQAYSPFGILCNLHAEEVKDSWEPKTGDGKKLRNFISYRGTHQLPPKDVEQWLGVNESFWSRLFGYESFESFANEIEKLSKENDA